MNTGDPLAQLRDIHEPAAVAWWPPAPGWWLLALLIIVLVALALYWAVQSWRAAAYRRHARNELRLAYTHWRQDAESTRYLEQLNEILKRTALVSFPRADIASLSGESWCAFLDRQGNGVSGGFQGSALESLYSPGLAPSDAELEDLHQLALAWIIRHRGES